MAISKKLNSKKILQTGGELICPTNISGSATGIIKLVHEVINFSPDNTNEREIASLFERIAAVEENETPYTFALEDSIDGINKNLFIDAIKKHSNKTFSQSALKQELYKIMREITPPVEVDANARAGVTTRANPAIDDVDGPSAGASTGPSAVGGHSMVGGVKKRKPVKKASKKTSKKASKKTSKTMKGGKKSSKKSSKKTSKKASKKGSKTMKGGKKTSKKTSKKASKKSSKKTSKKASKKSSKTSKKGSKTMKGGKKSSKKTSKKASKKSSKNSKKGSKTMKGGKKTSKKTSKKASKKTSKKTQKK